MAFIFQRILTDKDLRKVQKNDFGQEFYKKIAFNPEIKR
jgi:hypothetical protein